MLKHLSAAILFASVAQISGCATFHSNNVKPIQQFPQTSTQKHSVSINFHYTVNINESTVNSKPAENALSTRCIERFTASKLFSQVAANQPNADIQVNIDMKDDAHPNLGMAFLTGLSLFLIPSHSSDHYFINAEIKNTKNGKSTKVAMDESLDLYQQILLLPLAPFMNPFSVAPKVQGNMFDNLALQTWQSDNAADVSQM